MTRSNSIEHLYPFVRSASQLEKAIGEIDEAPGVVLFTLVDKDLAQRLVAACHELNVPCHSVLQPISDVFRAYLGSPGAARPGAQHMLNAYYFNRVEALNYTMLHDDGQTADDYEAADILLLGVSRTSKTPTSIYLANRGYQDRECPDHSQCPAAEGDLPAAKAADRRSRHLRRPARCRPPATA